jgi:hypothetical protein
MMRSRLGGVGGIFTPWLAWMATTPSVSAVVRIALSTEPLLFLMVWAEAPLPFIQVTHWRTCSGRMSRILIGPKNGSR